MYILDFISTDASVSLKLANSPMNRLKIPIRILHHIAECEIGLEISCIESVDEHIPLRGYLE